MRAIFSTSRRRFRSGKEEALTKIELSVYAPNRREPRRRSGLSIEAEASARRAELTPCMDCACFNLRKATRVTTQYYDEILRPAGIRITQFSLLVAVTIAGSVTVTRLAELSVMDRTTSHAESGGVGETAIDRSCAWGRSAHPNGEHHAGRAKDADKSAPALEDGSGASCGGARRVALAVPSGRSCEHRHDDGAAVGSFVILGVYTLR